MLSPLKELLLEPVLAVPVQIGRVRPMGWIARLDRPPAAIDELPDAVDVVRLAGDEHIEIV